MRRIAVISLFALALEDSSKEVVANFDNASYASVGKPNITFIDKMLYQVQIQDVEQDDRVQRLLVQEASERICRICFEEENSNVEVLVSPCKCTGSQKWVHVGCIQRWYRATLRQSQAEPHICRVCQSRYTCPVQVQIIVNLIVELRDGTQEDRADAASVFQNLAEDLENHDAIRQEGGIKALIKVLREGCNDDAHIGAAGALFRLASKGENHDVIQQEGGIQVFIKLLREGGCDDVQMSAAGALASLASSGENRNEIQQGGGVQALIKVLHEGRHQTQFWAADALGRLAINSVDIDLKRKTIRALTKVLREGGNDRIVGVLGRLSTNSANFDVIRKEQGIQAFIKVLRDGGSDMANIKAAGALARLASNSQNSDVILQEEGVQALIKVLREGTILAQSDAAAALERLASNSAKSDVKRGIIRALITVLGEGNDDAQSKAAIALYRLASSNETSDLIRKEGGIQALEKVLREGGHKDQVVFALKKLTLRNESQDVVYENEGIG